MDTHTRKLSKRCVFSNDTLTTRMMIQHVVRYFRFEPARGHTQTFFCLWSWLNVQLMWTFGKWSSRAPKFKLHFYNFFWLLLVLLSFFEYTIDNCVHFLYENLTSCANFTPHTFFCWKFCFFWVSEIILMIMHVLTISVPWIAMKAKIP